MVLRAERVPAGPEVPVLARRPERGRVDDGLRKEVVSVFFEIVLFVLSAFGLVTAGREFLRRGHNLGLWGA